MNDDIIIAGRRRHRLARRTINGSGAAALLVSCAAAALVAGGATPAQAQDGGATFLDTIAVVGTRTETSVQDNPASVSVLDTQQLERKAPESIAEMLREVPGVQVMDASAPGMKRLSIRGESSRRVTILVDGQEITDHSTYGTPILVDPSNVERIEVVRGPASVLHGAKAIGGVVNIITKKGAGKPVQFETGGTYYSGTEGWQGWAAVSGTVGNFDYRFSGSVDDHDDRHVPKGRYTSTGRLDGTSFGNDNISAHLGYRFGDAGNHYIALKAEQHRLSTESWTDPDYLDATVTHFNIDLPKRDLRKVGVFYDGTDISDVVRKVHVDAYYQTVDRLFMNEVTTRVPPTPPMIPRGGEIAVRSSSDDRNVNYGGTAQVDLQFHPDHYTIVGLHYLADELSTDKLSERRSNIVIAPSQDTRSVDDASIHTVSAFAQNEWSFADDFKLTTGVRYYHTQISHDQSLFGQSLPPRGAVAVNPVATSPDSSEGRLVTSAGLTYTGIENTTLRALYSEGYITPTLLQLYTATTAGSGTTTLGNPMLESETSRNVEIGARYNAGDLVLDAAAFYTRAKNYITRTPCTAQLGCSAADVRAGNHINVNADAATTYGLELAAEYTVPGTAFTPYVTGTWMRRKLELTETFGKWATYDTNTPVLSGRFGLRWEGEVANHDAWADLYVRAATGVDQTTWVAQRAPLVSRFETESLPGWATLNFAFGGSFGGEDDDRFRYAVNFNNILDKEYRSSFEEIPGVGRSVEVSLRMKF